MHVANLTGSRIGPRLVRHGCRLPLLRFLCQLEREELRAVGEEESMSRARSPTRSTSHQRRPAVPSVQLTRRTKGIQSRMGDATRGAHPTKGYGSTTRHPAKSRPTRSTIPDSPQSVSEAERQAARGASPWATRQIIRDRLFRTASAIRGLPGRRHIYAFPRSSLFIRSTI